VGEEGAAPNLVAQEPCCHRTMNDWGLLMCLLAFPLQVSHYPKGYKADKISGMMASCCCRLPYVRQSVRQVTQQHTPVAALEPAPSGTAQCRACMHITLMDHPGFPGQCRHAIPWNLARCSCCLPVSLFATGLGMNASELKKNPVLTDWWVGGWVGAGTG
jgi:hypothetical protein